MIKTKQELLNHFSDINEMYNNPFMYQTLNNMIDELLEKQPCDDCISREELLKLLDSKTVDTNPDHFNFKDKKDYERWVLHNGYNTGLVQARIYVGELPPVTPSYNSIKTELDHVIDEIIIRIEQTRDKDKLCEYPYNRCIDIVREVLGDD